MGLSLCFCLSLLLTRAALDILSVICDEPWAPGVFEQVGLSVCVKVRECVSCVTGVTLGSDNFRQRV